MYSLFRKILFSLPPEVAHKMALMSLAAAHRLQLTSFFPVISNPKKMMGLTFQNQIGLAAGLDKNGDYIDALASLGFGFVEIGTVTPRPQPGNAKPRLFRLQKEEALINRMGFNNKGVDHAVKKLQQRKCQNIIGVNIGKNFSTPIERAVDDYLFCFERVYRFADYVTVNISSPNTPSLRNLQHGELLKNLLQTRGTYFLCFCINSY